jgi:hypothetical protein
VGAHYFEEGNVQLDAKHECKDATIFQVITISASLLAWNFFIMKIQLLSFKT